MTSPQYAIVPLPALYVTEMARTTNTMHDKGQKEGTSRLNMHDELGKYIASINFSQYLWTARSTKVDTGVANGSESWLDEC